MNNIGLGMISSCVHMRGCVIHDCWARAECTGRGVLGWVYVGLVLKLHDNELEEVISVTEIYVDST
jgi:hypothetical protein